MEQRPDLSHYHAIHDKMRSDLERFLAALDMTTSRREAVRVTALARWAIGFGHELHAHHTIEDDVVFLDLAARVPSVQQLLDELGADHDRVAELLADLGPAADMLADRRRSFEEARTALITIGTELRDLLERHLDIEDDVVLPMFAANYTKTEYDDLTARVAKSIPKKGLFFSIPWNIEAQPEATRQEMLAEAPAVLRIVFLVANRRYQRLVAAAFDGIPVPAPRSRATLVSFG